MELPKHPGFAKQEQDAAPTDKLLPQKMISRAPTEGLLTTAREVEAAQTADSQPSATDRKSDSDSGRQVIDEVALSCYALRARNKGPRDYPLSPLLPFCPI